MGPKKKPEPGAEDNEQKVTYLTNKAQALQAQIIWEQERADRAKTEDNQLRERLIKLDEEFKSEAAKLYKISTEMNEQYRVTQQQLKGQIAKKKEELKEKEQAIKKSQQVLESTRLEKQSQIQQKDKEIEALKGQMAQLTTHFSKMLRETLEKMQERIELQQWDNDSDPQIARKMNELADTFN